MQGKTKIVSENTTVTKVIQFKQLSSKIKSSQKFISIFRYIFLPSRGLKTPENKKKVTMDSFIKLNKKNTMQNNTKT